MNKFTIRLFDDDTVYDDLWEAGWKGVPAFMKDYFKDGMFLLEVNVEDKTLTVVKQ